MSRRTIALVGDPVGESPSPAIHNAAFAALGLPFEYVAVTVGRGELGDRFAALRERCAGLNVTIPHKEAVLPLLDSLTPEARLAGSANTVRFDGNASLGASTDGQGFVRALRRAVPGRSIQRSVVIGTGGAARAVAAALAACGGEVLIAGRRREAATRVAREIPGVRPLALADAAEALGGCDLLASAIPPTAWETPQWPIPPQVLAAGSGAPLIVFDLVARPRRTPLLREAAARGCVTIEGVEMLVEQAELSFTFWTGITPPIGLMRAAAHRALAATVHA